ncbi:hypothetical protein AJ80_02471 [Polytolypa hystricis UAMH7299]|uniref:Peroxisomal membrane protein PEX14 n=1 Tax=Polytolypa hystricis (strain UAMH7299) TaxID=1447883 RepID=A0A2B7YSC4_POLH7|nr:hypothetical protein AJ80_02471 [Polytolypa hystricis UAMH7299]
MGDSSQSKKSSIPSWQLPSGSTTPKPTTENEPDKSDQSPEDTLLEQASRFLQEESIRDAPTDKKIAFLESKGLTNENIDKLLGVSRNLDASAPTPSTTTTAEEHTQQESSPSTNASNSESSNNPPASTSTQPPTPNRQPASSASPSTRSVPPIITYPEFLLEASKPPPLITFRGVAYTLYGAAGLAATIYGASKFLVTPMLESLTSARHDLSSTAQRNLQTLNEKLEENVSTIPPAATVASKSHANDGPSSDEEEDNESVTSDPTELFHRDIATQTSPELSQAPSSSSASADDTSDTPATTTTAHEKVLSNHLKRLQTISSHLHEFLSDDKGSETNHTQARDSISELQTYLDGLAYNAPAYVSGSGMYSVYDDMAHRGGSGGLGSGGGSGGAKLSRDEEAINAFRAEIRSVKGTLLSARNFPVGGNRGRVVGVSTAS